MRNIRVPFVSAVLLVAVLLSPASMGDIVINEIAAGGSERLLQWDAAGNPRLGTGAQWYQAAFSDATWQAGPGPFGYGTISGGPSYGTNTATQMQYLTPDLYLRKTFEVSATDQARPDQVQLTVNYNDGFICYVNGVEVVRRWAGPAKQFHFHDQPAYNPNLNNAATTGFYSETINLGAANVRLVAGTNQIAIQALNITPANTTFLMRATLAISGTPSVALINASDTWKYLPGVIEPSGNLSDPALILSGKLNVPWGANTGYDDSAWGVGPGPIGAGTAAGTGTLVPGVINSTPSIYLRAIFNVTAAQAADPAALTLLVDYDDSFVAYVNGVEVARANIGNVSGGVTIPNTFTPSTAVANATRNNGAQITFPIDPPTRLLKEGLNVLAIQVHNVAINDPDMFFKADLKTAGGTFLVTNNQQWKYFAGTTEPVSTEDTGTEDSPEGPDYASNWIELYNNGATPVLMNGWRLTDDPGDATKWFFPPGVTIPAGGYLVLFCDGADVDLRSVGGYIHTNFKLDNRGEYLALRDANAVMVQDFSPTYPPASSFHTYGRNAAGNYVFSDMATPGAANSGNELSGFVADPKFNLTGGFYSTAQTVTLSTTTPGASIRYTTNGAEPTETTGNAFGSSINVAASLPIRARAFKPGMIPSKTVTNTYLINQLAARKSLPAMVITADPDRSLYRRYGVFAITNNSTLNDGTNNYLNSLWYSTEALDPAQYNNPNLRGFFVERPGNLQFMQKIGSADPSGAAGFNLDFGIRAAGSPFSRPRYIFSWLGNPDPNSVSPFASSSTDKPQINAFFRDDYGNSPLQYPLFPGSAVTTFDNLRLRSGKNDISNPFIRDELTRRLFIDMGQVCVHGIFTTLWINGVYKGYYNPVERPRESFFQRAFGSNKSWDVWVINDAASGDNLMLQELITYVLRNPPTTLANYQGAASRLDMTNFVDYLILNVYEAMGDWPHNNYVMARERSTNAKWILTVWDGEGSYGSFNTTARFNNFTPVGANSNTSSAIVSTAPSSESIDKAVRILYTMLRTNAEFKILFADRLQKHLVNGNGALSDTNILARKNAMKNDLTTLFASYSPPIIFSESGINDWVNGAGTDRTRYTLSGGTSGTVVNSPSRKTVLFNGYTDDTAGGVFIPALLRQEGLFPATLAPAVSQPGGNVAAGFQLTVTNPNAGGTIYYTVDGTDPRAVGGAVAGTTYTGPITINQTTVVKLRIRNTNNEWSPLREETYVVAQLPAVLITELMYHPAGQGTIDGDDFEFIELKNVGSTQVNLNGWQLTNGISFTFPAGTSLAPGAFAVVAAKATRFSSRYPAVPLAGEYTGSLANGGDTVTLRDLTGAAVMALTYSDAPPWPTLPDGFGNSLVPVNPNANATPSSASSWRASAAVNGSPGADDPAPTIPAVLVNELLTNASGTGKDKVEIYNPTADTVDISGWFLSDSTASPKKFRIPDGNLVAPNGYVVLSETDFNAVPPVGSNVAFAFDATGEEVRLSSADAAGNLTGYAHGFAFDAAAPDVSFGRYVNSVGIESFPAQKAQSFGAANAGPLIGPVVLSELMYFPTPTTDEFVELRNISSSPVQLFDPANPANGWKISGIGYTFPGGVTLQPGQMIIVTPLTESAWRAKYNSPASIQVYGPYAGNLDNTGERVSLQMPGPPFFNASNQIVIPYVTIDAVAYKPIAPWPTSPAGAGPSLERFNWLGYGDDPASWRASPANGGTPGTPAKINLATWQTVFFSPSQIADPMVGVLGADPDGDGLTNQTEWALGLNPLSPDLGTMMSTSLAMDGANGPYLTVQFRRSLGISPATFELDTASAVGTWVTNGVMLGSVTNGDGTATITMRDTVPVTGGTPPQRFVRLKITGN